MSAARNDRTPVVDDPAATAHRYWPVPLLRAVPAVVLALVVTFSADHSPRFGLTVAGATVLAGGVLLAAATAWRLDDPSSRTLGIVQGIVGVVAGAAALLLLDGGLPAFVAVVSSWALVSGALELVTGLRRRRRSPLSRDWTTVGALTLVLALVVLVVPPDYSTQLGGIEQVSGELTASIVLVGVLGAYGALVGVFLVIAGLSLRWQPSTTATTGTTADGATTP